MIAPCTCQHKYQDEVYGKGLRVHNPCKYNKAADLKSGLRCTVCGNVKPA